MSLWILFEQYLSLAFYYILIHIFHWSELETLSFLTSKRGWAWMYPNKLLISDADIAHEILVRHSSSHFQKASIHEDSPLSGSMLNDSDRKPHSRSLLVHSLSSKQIKENYIPIILDCTKTLVNYWKSKLASDSMIVDVTDDCARLALDIVGETLIGGTFGACSYDDNGNRLTQSMLHLTRETFTAKNHEKQIDMNGRHQLDFIDNLIQHRWATSDRTLDFADTKLILFAGSETTATAMALTLLTLAYRNDIQIQLREQLYGLSTFEIIQNSLLDSFIHEILRFWAIAPFITRRSTRDLTCQNSSGRTLLIPNNTDIDILVWSIHRSPLYYIRVDELNITRTYSNKRSYLPFSTGSRMCPGMEFAITELKIIVALLLEQIEFEPLVSISPLDCSQFLSEQQFHIDWYHAVIHTKEHVCLKIRPRLPVFSK
ncbi:unnamed protein product [Rotaria socialis]|uniref:Cytochrome P450 n=2 Tax=Rotaria socialis TaxID=392032 RepID=A0A820PXE1_9BILA|nr:unnamed protein product [Rotaria socialis]CAF3411691.1 unnamed protein product [Rotaria socialis]CAF3436954.1 unnamed protein product [Rotaria socialis]CAF3457756.1 unnamed protein product [Rotaria socialis]CAF4412868.1 unnamed protein product [Rotaria socialis]